MTQTDLPRALLGTAVLGKGQAGGREGGACVGFWGGTCWGRVSQKR